MSAFETMTMDNWLGIFMMLIMFKIITSIYKEHCGFVEEGDLTGVKVVRWSVVIGIIMLIAAMIVDALGFAGIL